MSDEEMTIASVLESAEALTDGVGEEGAVAAPIVLTIEAIPVVDRESATRSLGFYAALKKEIKNRKEDWELVKRPAKAIYDQIRDAEKEYFALADELLAEVYQNLVDFADEDQSRVRSEQTAAHELAEVHRAQEAPESPFSAPPAVVPQFPTDLAPFGLTRRAGWQGEVVDGDAFIAAYKGGLIPEYAMVPAKPAQLADLRETIGEVELAAYGVLVRAVPTFALKAERKSKGKGKK